jgi:hypothetical protein
VAASYLLFVPSIDLFVSFLQILTHLEHAEVANKEMPGFAPARRSGINALTNLRTPDDVFQWLLGSVPSDKFFKNNWERYAARLPIKIYFGRLDLNGCQSPGICTYLVLKNPSKISAD